VDSCIDTYRKRLLECWGFPGNFPFLKRIRQLVLLGYVCNTCVFSDTILDSKHHSEQSYHYLNLQTHSLFKEIWTSVQFSSVQSLSRVWLFSTPWIAARQTSLSITNSRSPLRLKFIESVMPSSHLILWPPLLLLPSIPPSIRVFSNESALRMRWPKYWSFSFSIIPSKEIPGLISFRMDWLDLLAVTCYSAEPQAFLGCTFLG